ncbi:beta-galactosidase [Parabacteroides sp. PF5-5]|uniref:beta-galactosidase n=1 Tax=unclassified Parabacteroides TaxID=2649774 RepID=UPI0024743A53|nr:MULTISPECIES: beta-galactosidase [unclassified Parabacteroides]MDH6303429.1 beta-galactosidase [Parabacteroides sp. PH5-39]MDH6314752.1 beta-galactosidase [Parabacteroides sp. PF5-13]MDH6318089.1 beta-galactosidase [Parabacteroides sp. PH5-13]MDH6321980.1 beta-galactosidase [Parabacteroides sp. PH5-8]MDH6326103.1 beta-galactosidase [Parabacteroides sp. PH5-41]
MKKKIFTTLLGLVVSFSILAQYKFDNVLYGAAYYHEYMPSERLDKDIQMMKNCGLSVVRVGESSWGIFEPQEGVFEFEWMDTIIDKMHKAGIKVILGTPTYSMPAWLTHKHPEVLAEHTRGNKAYYGIRQNMDFTNPTFKFYSERIIRKMMERYAKHPAIIGYQVDNEIEARGINNRDYFVGFRNYMKDRFNNDLNLLTKEWGMNYWGMNINTWEEFYTRDGVTNPSYKNEWERYNRKMVADFLSWQCDIVNEYKRADQFVTHCFMPAFHNVDQVESFKKMQYPAINVYHDVQDKQDGQWIAYSGDFMRTAAKDNYIVMETNAQGIGWDARNQRPPYDKQLRQNVYSHYASGANMVEYWHWATLHYGQETYWRGVLGHDLEPNRVYNEFKETAEELKKIGSKLVNLKKKNKVAILYSHDSYHALNFMPYTYKDNYPVNSVHKALYMQNIETDIVPCDKWTDFSAYSMLVIPPLYVATDELLASIDAFVKGGGHVLMMHKSGYCNEHSAVRTALAPGPLRNACGFYYQEYSTIDNMSLKDHPFELNEKDQISDWYEFLVTETATPLAYADHPFFGKWPVITENTYGKGSLTYIGTYPSQELLDKVIRRVAVKADIITSDCVTFPVIMRSGINQQGKTIHYLFNYSDKTKEIKYPYSSGKDVLSGKSVNANELLHIAPWDVAIVEEK